MHSRWALLERLTIVALASVYLAGPCGAQVAQGRAESAAAKPPSIDELLLFFPSKYPRGLVLQSTFSSLKDVADVHYPKLSWLVPPAKLDSVAQIVRYHGPLLQSHGTADRTIPISSGEKLFLAANEPKTFAKIPGADHNNWLTEDYLTQLDKFIRRLASEGNRTSN
jgi:fermentation-respiration switch protein FrsA (DUF1100 family)